MTFYEKFPKTKHPQAATCTHCGHEYLLGITGTIEGCDACLGIWRNLDGMIIEQRFHFAEEVDVDALTDMEKS